MASILLTRFIFLSIPSVLEIPDIASLISTTAKLPRELSQLYPRKYTYAEDLWKLDLASLRNLVSNVDFETKNRLLDDGETGTLDLARTATITTTKARRRDLIGLSIISRMWWGTTVDEDYMLAAWIRWSIKPSTKRNLHKSLLTSSRTWWHSRHKIRELTSIQSCGWEANYTSRKQEVIWKQPLLLRWFRNQRRS